MMFKRSVSFLLVFLCGSDTAAARLRSVESIEANGESLQASLELFRVWAETHDKEYTTEEEAKLRWKVWMDNHGTS